MIRDKRGEGGFMEAIIAFAAVTTALTIFLGLLAYSEIGNSDSTIDLDTEFIENMTIENGRFSEYDDSNLHRFIERNGLNGTELRINVAGHLSDASIDDTIGVADGNNVGTMSGTFPVHTDDGRTFVASYEVIYWWD